MRYYDSYAKRFFWLALFIIFTSVLSYSMFHSELFVEDKFWMFNVTVFLWTIIVLALARSLFIPRLLIHNDQVISFGMWKKVIHIKDIKELSIDKNFVFVSYKAKGQIHKLGFTIMNTDTKEHIYIYNGKFQK